MNFYQNLYYRLFIIWIKKKKELLIAHINAVITLTFLLFLNLASIPLIFMVIFGPSSIKYPSDTNNLKIITVFALVTVGILNYIYLARPQKLNRIVDYYKDEDESAIKRGRIIGWSYVLISLGIPSIILLFSEWIFS